MDETEGWRGASDPEGELRFVAPAVVAPRRRPKLSVSSTTPVFAVSSEALLIVVCPSCQAQYKLDPSRLGGRGAKARCKRCGNMMSIEPVAAPAEDASDERTEVQPTAHLTPRPAARLHTPVVVPSLPPTPSRAPAPTPGLRVAPASRAPDPPPLHMPRSVADRVAAAPHFAVADYPPLTGEEAAVVARSLDFLQLGIPCWKGRTRDGRIVDFQDTRTLRAFVADGRLSPQDTISVDGHGWVPIAAIPDLESYFVATWEELNAARGGAPPPWSDPETRARLLMPPPHDGRWPTDDPPTDPPNFLDAGPPRSE